MLGFGKTHSATHAATDSIVQGDTVTWGNVELSETEALGHFLALGATGSGKSTILMRLMKSLFHRIGRGQDCRALVYDAKQDVLPLLSTVAPHAKVVTTLAYDKRGAGWLMSRDVREPAVAIEIAFTLIPPTHESQPFFADAARHLLYAIIVSFILTGEPWTLATLIRALKKPKRIVSILKRHSYTREVIGQYFYDDKLVMNIMSTLATKLLPYEPIAAAWESARETFSIEEWAQDDGILVLGNYETGRTAIDAINRCIFKRASDVTLNQGESRTRRTYVIIDETSEAGKLDGLPSLMKKGRSKGASVTLAFQSISGLRDPKLYGQYFTDEILGQIANRFIGRLECVTTAEWASTIFGDQEVVTESHTHTRGPSGNSSSVSRQPQVRRMVLPGELMSIPACNCENGLSGFYVVRSAGVYFDTIPPDEAFADPQSCDVRDVRGFEQRPPMAQLLRAWSKHEQKCFGAKRTKSPTPKPDLSRTKLEHPASLPALDDLDSLFD